MKATEFCYWLQGLFELGNPEMLHAPQTDLIKRHLAMVFLHDIDPSYPADEQAALDDLHAGKKPGMAKLGGKDPLTGHTMRC